MRNRTAIGMLILSLGLATSAWAEGPLDAEDSLGRQLATRLAPRVQARVDAWLEAHAPELTARAWASARGASHMHCEALHASLTHCTIRLERSTASPQLAGLVNPRD